MINNPLAQVGFGGGPLAPTTVAAALSAASYSGATAVTSSMSIIFNEYYLVLHSFSVISNMLNPTTAIPNPISQPTVVSSPGIRSK
jgi:hypothetical protein